MKLSLLSKRFCATVVLMLGLMVPATAATPAASALPAATDVFVVFDTTGSMSKPITEAKEEIQESIAQIKASLPDVQFGLAEVSDYNEVNNGEPFTYGIGEGHDAFTLRSPITPNESQVVSELLKLSAAGGGDGPEAYGRALYEADANPAVGWRPGARSVILLVADNIPHDNDVNEGIPGDVQVEGLSSDTGIDPGADNTVGTADDLDWQNTVLQRLILDGKPIGAVDYRGGLSGYLPYWEHWAGLTGGTALDGESGFLGHEIVDLVKSAAEAALPACPVGLLRDVGENCVSPPPPPIPPPSNRFKYEPRISCASGCRTVLVKITFDSAGNVIAESIPEEEGKTGRVARTSQSRAVAGLSLKKKGKGRKKGNGCKRGKIHRGGTKKGGKRAHSSVKAGGGKKGGKKRGNGCRRPKLIRKLEQPVAAGANTLRLKLTGAAIKQLNKKGRVRVGIRINFTPTGGATGSSDHTYLIKAPKSKKNGKKRGHSKQKGKKRG